MFAITTAPSGGTIAQRKQNGGALEVGKAVNDSDAMPKKQVEDGFVAKVTDAAGIQVYTAVGNETIMIPVRDDAGEWSIPRRDGLGNINVGTPVGVNAATNKAYVDGGFVAKIGKATQAGTILYGRDFNGNEKGFIVESIAHNANTMVQRKSGGAVEVGTAVSDSDAMPKKQVEDNFIPKSTFTGAWQVLVTGENSDAITTRGMSVDPANHNIPNFDNQGRLLSNNPDGTAPTETSDKYAVNVGYANANYAAKLTQPYVVYLNDGEGKLFPAPYNYQPYHDAVVCYDGIGCLRTNDPNGEDGRLCVNKQYADAHYLTKLTTATVNTYIYGYDSTGDKQFILRSEDTPYTIPIRGAGGILQVGTPVGVNDATTKAYVDDGFVKSVAGTTNAPAVYIRGQDGTDKTASLDSLTASAYSVAQRDVNGNIKVGTASANGDAVNKQYVDGKFVAKGTVNQAVYVRRSNGTDTMIPYTDGSSQETIAYRGAGGVLGVGTPTQAGHATTKAYVDNLNAITITAGA